MQQCSAQIEFLSKRVNLHWFNVNGLLSSVSTRFVWPVGAQDSSLKLWDLRKLKNFKTITLDNNYEVFVAVSSVACFTTLTESLANISVSLL